MEKVIPGIDGTILSKDPLKPWELPVLEDDSQNELDISLVTYWSQGLKVKAYLIVPKIPAADGASAGGDSPAWPGLVYCRGGIRSVGMVRLPRMMGLARRGYAVMAPVYRGNMGGDGREDFGGEDRHDLINAVKALRSLPFVKDRRVPLIGFSRGAIMAIAAAIECGDVGPVAVWGGVSDLFLTYEERVDLRRMLRRVVGHPKKQTEEYRRRSPRYLADKIQCPVLIIHGSDDKQVSVKHAHDLAQSLEQAGRTYAMRLYDGLGHVFPKDSDEDALEAIFDWFKKHSES